jgi:hypothetical protein
MKKLSVVFASFALAAVVAVPAAHAQATRTWVSGVGDDVNPCSRTAPCKTFAGAISKTAAGGEISVLDPGSYGAVTITKALTINGDGTLAGIIITLGSNAITVNAGVNDRVVLRNISLNGVGTGGSGIRFLAGKSLLVDNVKISGFVTRGIDVSLAASADVFIKDTTITNATTGIRISTTTGLALAAIDNVHLEGQVNGLEVATNSRATISNSVISGNSSNGVLASTATAVINVEGCQLVHNAVTAINASVSGATIRISDNQIYNNTAGLTIAAGGVVNSTGNNRIFANGSSAAPTGPAITQQ